MKFIDDVSSYCIFFNLNIYHVQDTTEVQVPRRVEASRYMRKAIPDKF